MTLKLCHLCYTQLWRETHFGRQIKHTFGDRMFILATMYRLMTFYNNIYISDAFYCILSSSSLLFPFVLSQSSHLSVFIHFSVQSSSIHVLYLLLKQWLYRSTTVHVGPQPPAFFWYIGLWISNSRKVALKIWVWLQCADTQVRVPDSSMRSSHACAVVPVALSQEQCHRQATLNPTVRNSPLNLSPNL